MTVQGSKRNHVIEVMGIYASDSDSDSSSHLCHHLAHVPGSRNADVYVVAWRIQMVLTHLGHS